MKGIPTMIITNIINVSNGEEYGEYINALNVINSILNGTYRVNEEEVAEQHHVIDLCAELLSNQMGHGRGSTELAFPQYVANLVNKYCLNLMNIMVFWHCMDNMAPLKQLFCIDVDDDELPFFDLSVLLGLFPNITQIEYCNESFLNGKVSSKNGIKKIMKYILQCQLYIKDHSQIEYVLIHHKTASLTLNCGYFEMDTDDDDAIWGLYQDHHRVILHRKREQEFNVNSIDIRFNKIKQGNITHRILQTSV